MDAFSPLARRPQAPKPIREAAALEHWAASAMPGSLAEYHRGHLAEERAKAAPQGAAERERIGGIASAAFRLWRSGRVHLVQRRAGGGFSYLAVARQAGANLRS